MSLPELLAQIAASPVSGARVVAAAEGLSAEYARYNIWCYGRKGAATTSELWHLAALAGRQLADVETAWTTFRTAPAEEARDAERLVLAAELQRLHAELREVITTGANTYRDPDMPAEFND